MNDYLQSELEKEREAKEKFRIAAKESEVINKQLQEEFNVMKEEVEVKTMVKLVDLQSKLISHRNEFENVIKWLLPDSKVRYMNVRCASLAWPDWFFLFVLR